MDLCDSNKYTLIWMVFFTSAEGGTNQWESWCCDKLGAHQVTNSSRDKPQTNGRAENLIRWALEDIKVQLYSSVLQLKYWTYAARQAEYVREYLTWGGDGKKRSPHEILYGEVPDYKKLHPWVVPFGAPGCLAFSRHRQAVGKLSDRGCSIYFLSKGPKVGSVTVLIGGKAYDVPVSNCTFDRNQMHDWTMPEEIRQVRDKKQVTLLDPRRPLKPMRPAADKFDLKELESFLSSPDLAKIKMVVPGMDSEDVVVDIETQQKSILENFHQQLAQEQEKERLKTISKSTKKQRETELLLQERMREKLLDSYMQAVRDNKQLKYVTVVHHVIAHVVTVK